MNTIVITMAGRGSRFHQAGYLEPKYQIKVHGKSLFDWSLLSLSNFIEPQTRIIFVCLAENHSREYVFRRCDLLGLNNIDILELKALTDGQATSAYLSHHLWSSGGSLLIYNIDTYINPIALHPKDIKEGADGWIPCFKPQGDHWSFVKVNEKGWATNVEEKKRISENASVGLYWFSNSNDFINAYEKYFSSNSKMVSGEKYVAPIFNQLINEFQKIGISNLKNSDVHVLGTPQELKAFQNLKAL